jgi:hypothetical protein
MAQEVQMDADVEVDVEMDVDVQDRQDQGARIERAQHRRKQGEGFGHTSEHNGDAAIRPGSVAPIRGGETGTWTPPTGQTRACNVVHLANAAVAAIGEDRVS